MKLNQNGIGAVIVVFAVLVLATIGFVGWRAIEPESGTKANNQAITETEKDTETKATLSPEPTKETLGIVIKSGNSQFGEMLFNNDGQAIYIWELENSAEAKCYEDCAKAWPPVLTNGKPQASGNIRADLLGTTKRTDGTTQVTYNGHPLYYYAHEKAGEVKCHNISTHGGLWWVIKPNGERAV